MFSTLECGIPYMRNIKFISPQIIKLPKNSDSDSDFCIYESGLPYMRKAEYKKTFKEHEDKSNETKSSD